jgi:hypothetical protein
MSNITVTLLLQVKNIVYSKHAETEERLVRDWKKRLLVKRIKKKV